MLARRAEPRGVCVCCHVSAPISTYDPADSTLSSTATKKKKGVVGLDLDAAWRGFLQKPKSQNLRLLQSIQCNDKTPLSVTTQVLPPYHFRDVEIVIGNKSMASFCSCDSPASPLPDEMLSPNAQVSSRLGLDSARLGTIGTCSLHLPQHPICMQRVYSKQ